MEQFVEEVFSVSYNHSTAVPSYSRNASFKYFLPLHFIKWLWIFYPPLLLLFGSFGNVMVIIIVSRMRSSESSLNAYLVALACSDLGALFTGLVTLWVDEMWHVDLLVIHSGVCMVGFFVLYVTSVLSPWLLVIMTTQRALSVIWPLRINVLCTLQKSKLIAILVTLLICAIHAHIPFNVDIVYYDNNSVSCFTRSTEYGDFLSTTWSWVDLNLASIVPFCLVVVNNGVLVWTLVASTNRVTVTMTIKGALYMKARERKDTSITMTLIAMSVSFLVLHVCLPYSVYILGVPLDDEDEVLTRDDEEFYRLVSSTVRLLWYSNNSVNFYLYSLTGSKFRNALKKTLCCCRCKPVMSLSNSKLMPQTTQLPLNDDDT